jgi:DNA-binding response OmpR family regulator
MAERPLVLILSEDELLRELLSERFRQDHLEVQTAADLRDAADRSRAVTARVVVIDAMGDPALASQLLDDPYAVFEDAQPPFVLLSSSATPVAVRDHGFIDRVVGVPLSSDEIVSAALTCANGRARREMQSGIRVRSAVDETFKTKKKSIAP